MHTALYRKKRPIVFEDVIGQNSIVTTLCNQLRGGHITHAYLFCGTRGTGKTSCAKIFARAVNCPHSAEAGEPCNNCEICGEILAERSLNVIEIDAASNNGVDNIRDLREEVRYPPSSGRYKVYIIDEAHMLTTAAFNALLKTLEEPPGHVIFILATTDPAKIPVTILSRCQRYDFKRITRADMVNTLSAYMEKDGTPADKDALEYIASVSDGAMRDALSILDQCLSLYSGSAITLEKVQALLGAVDQSALFDYGEALMQSNTAKALAIIAEATKEGRDLIRFTSDIITHFRNLLVAAQAPDILDYAPETVERYRKHGANTDPNILISYIREFSELQNQMRFLPQERLALEVCSVKLTSKIETAAVQAVEEALPESVTQIIDEVPPGPVAQTISETPPEPITQTTQDLPSEAHYSPSYKEDGEKAGDDFTITADRWKDFCATFSGLLKPMLSLCQVECGDIITITCRDQASLQYIKDQEALITAEVTKYFKLPKESSILFKANSGYNDTDKFKENIQQQISIPIEFH